MHFPFCSQRFDLISTRRNQEQYLAERPPDVSRTGGFQLLEGRLVPGDGTTGYAGSVAISTSITVSSIAWTMASRKGRFGGAGGAGCTTVRDRKMRLRDSAMHSSESTGVRRN
jgi:hypothetical protein